MIVPSNESLFLFLGGSMEDKYVGIIDSGCGIVITRQRNIPDDIGFIRPFDRQVGCCRRSVHIRASPLSPTLSNDFSING